MSCSRGDIDWNAAPSLFLGPTGTVSPHSVPTLTAAGPVGLTLISLRDCFWLPPADALSLPLLLSLPQAATVSAAAATRLTNATRQRLNAFSLTALLSPIDGCRPPRDRSDAVAKPPLAAID